MRELSCFDQYRKGPNGILVGITAQEVKWRDL